MICGGQEPLSPALLARAVSISVRELNSRLLPIRQLLKEIQPPSLMFTFWHKSVADWLVDDQRAGANFTVDPEEGHRILAQYCVREIERLKQSNASPHNVDAGYAIHAADHLSELRDWNEYHRLLNDDFYFGLCYGSAFLSGV